MNAEQEAPKVEEAPAAVPEAPKPAEPEAAPEAAPEAPGKELATA